MKRLTLLLLVFITFRGGIVVAENPKTFSEAKILSAQKNLPLLLEFVSDDCVYCEKAAREAETEEKVREALKTVVHFPLNITKGEGVELAKNYKVGIYYPVFFLCNSKAEIIKRWTGYNGADFFVNALKSGMLDPITINERRKRFQSEPSSKDAIFLAKYNSDIGEHLKAIDYYRKMQKSGASSRVDYSYEIFKNSADAAWKGMIDLDKVFPTADAVLAAKRKSKNNIIKVAQIMTRLTGKIGSTDLIAKYIQAGLKATANIKNDKYIEYHNVFKADYTLYIEKDTSRAIEMRKASLGENWTSNPEIYYRYSRWCLERKINLEEAEKYARMAAKRAVAGKYKALILSTLAEICYQRGNFEEAVDIINEAIGQDADNTAYINQLERIQGK